MGNRGAWRAVWLGVVVFLVGAVLLLACSGVYFALCPNGWRGGMPLVYTRTHRTSTALVRTSEGVRFEGTAKSAGVALGRLTCSVTQFDFGQPRTIRSTWRLDVTSIVPAAGPAAADEVAWRKLAAEAYAGGTGLSLSRWDLPDSIQNGEGTGKRWFVRAVLLNGMDHLRGRPVWSGICVGIGAVLGLVAWFVSRRRMWSAGECPKCGYDLTGLAGGVCPECGAGNTGNTGHAKP